jgi:hypothetical protein
MLSWLPYRSTHGSRHTASLFSAGLRKKARSLAVRFATYKRFLLSLENEAEGVNARHRLFTISVDNFVYKGAQVTLQGR